MIVVSTGISGTGEKEYALGLAELCKRNGRNLNIFNVGEMVMEQAKKSGIRITIEKVLNTHKDTIRALRADVFDIILSEISRLGKRGHSALVNIHGAFYWKNQYIQSIDYYYLSRLNPDLYVNFINNSDIVFNNLKNRKQWEFIFENKSNGYVLERVMEWQTVEYLATAIIANFSGKPVFVVPAGGDKSILYRLMFERWRKIFYLGMPLTFLHGDKHKMSRECIESFANWLTKYVILIDPRFMEPLKTDQLTAESQNESVHHNVVGRDFNLLSQCDGMIGFYPDAVTSYGENSERAEMHRTNGDTFLIYPKKEFLSPFFTEWADRIFYSEESFKPWFLNEYLSKDYLAKVEEAEKCYNGGHHE